MSGGQAQPASESTRFGGPWHLLSYPKNDIGPREVLWGVDLQGTLQRFWWLLQSILWQLLDRESRWIKYTIYTTAVPSFVPYFQHTIKWLPCSLSCRHRGNLDTAPLVKSQGSGWVSLVDNIYIYVYVCIRALIALYHVTKWFWPDFTC